MRARIIDTEAGPQTLYPLWASKRTIHELLGICDKLLMELVARGTVGFMKTGEAKQSAALYSFPDARAWCDARAKRKGGAA